MKVLVAFGTTEGQTQKIANHIDTLINSAGHSSILHNCKEADQAPDVASADAVLVAGSVHQQAHQPEVSEFVKTHLSDLQAKPSAFISVSLSVMAEDGQDEAQKYVTDFSEETNWTPKNVHLAAGAIRFLEYDFFKKFTIQNIVLKGHKMPDQSEGNPEFTDWDALDAFVTSFLSEASA